MPELLNASEAFALSVVAAEGLKAMGLPVAGARHAGPDLIAVAFNTPRGAVGVVAVPPGQDFSGVLARIRRIHANNLGKDGFK